MTARQPGNLSPRVAVRVSLTVGRRGVGWEFGRLVMDKHELLVRSLVPHWIPARSASRSSIGEISVVRRIEVSLPVFFWRRMDVVQFDPASSFADVQLRLPPRKRIAEELRARGYTVTQGD